MTMSEEEVREQLGKLVDASLRVSRYLIASGHPERDPAQGAMVACREETVAAWLRCQPGAAETERTGA
jgi:hypothetical protein